MLTRLLLFVFFAAIASAEIPSFVKSTNKDRPTSTALASARRATVTNTQYAINGVYPGSDSYGLATQSQAGTYTTTLASSAYGGAGSGVSMTVDTTTAAVKITGSGSVTDCVSSVSSYQSQSFVGTVTFTSTNTAPTSCSDLQIATYGSSITDTSKAAIIVLYAPIRTSSTTLATYLRTSSGNVASLTSGSGQTTGDAIASTETSHCGSGETVRMITVLSTVTMSSNSDWDAAAAQSIYTPIDITITCNTIPSVAIVGLEGTAVQAVCSGCLSSSVVSNPATKLQASMMSILLLGLLVIGFGRL